MSRNDWEEGTVSLPAAEYAKVRKAVAAAVTDHKEKVYHLAQEFWGGLTRSQKAGGAVYLSAVDAYVARVERSAGKAVAGDTHAILVGYSRLRKPSRVTKADMDFPTASTTVFHADDLEVEFHRTAGSLSWYVGENNHAVDEARNHPLGKAVFAALDQVRWTRGTGGVISGNDEQSGVDSLHGGAANYISVAFGPAGAEQSPVHCRPYTDAQGRHFTRTDLDNEATARVRREIQNRPSGPQPRGHNGHPGKFTYRQRTDSGLTLQ